MRSGPGRFPCHLFLVTLFFCVAAAQSANSTTPINLDNSCRALLTRDSLRAHIREIRDEYRARTAQVSLMLGKESEGLVTGGKINDHVISLGSGPDVFWPLFDFPEAGHIHLVDTFEGWGESESAVRREIVRRLAALDIREKPQLLEARANEETWEVIWGPQKTAPQTTYFHLNKVDYNDPKQMDRLLTELPAGSSLVGIFTSGAPIPSNNSLELLLDKLEPGHPLISVDYRQSSRSTLVDRLQRILPLGIQRRLMNDHTYLDLRLGSLGYSELEFENADYEYLHGIFKQYSYVYIKPVASTQK